MVGLSRLVMGQDVLPGGGGVDSIYGALIIGSVGTVVNERICHNATLAPVTRSVSLFPFFSLVTIQEVH